MAKSQKINYKKLFLEQNAKYDLILNQFAKLNETVAKQAEEIAFLKSNVNSRASSINTTQKIKQNTVKTSISTNTTGVKKSKIAQAPIKTQKIRIGKPLKIDTPKIEVKKNIVTKTAKSQQIKKSFKKAPRIPWQKKINPFYGQIEQFNKRKGKLRDKLRLKADEKLWTGSGKNRVYNKKYEKYRISRNKIRSFNHVLSEIKTNKDIQKKFGNMPHRAIAKAVEGLNDSVGGNFNVANIVFTTFGEVGYRAENGHFYLYTNNSVIDSDPEKTAELRAQGHWNKKGKSK